MNEIVNGGELFSSRAAVPEDVDFVLSLFARPHVAEQMHGPTRDGFIRALEREDFDVLIIERGGNAFGNLVLEHDATWLMTIRALAVWEEGCGAGRYAIAYAKHYAFDALKVHRIFLEVIETNERARRLYERAGFRQEGVYRDGFRHDDGRFANLVPYGMLESEPS